MNKFLVFAGSDFYPAGGAADLHSVHTTKAAAVRAAKHLFEHAEADWIHVYDLQAALYVCGTEEKGDQLNTGWTRAWPSFRYSADYVFLDRYPGLSPEVTWRPENGKA